MSLLDTIDALDTSPEQSGIEPGTLVMVEATNQGNAAGGVNVAVGTVYAVTGPNSVILQNPWVLLRHDGTVKESEPHNKFMTLLHATKVRKLYHGPEGIAPEPSTPERSGHSLFARLSAAMAPMPLTLGLRRAQEHGIAAVAQGANQDITLEVTRVPRVSIGEQDGMCMLQIAPAKIRATLYYMLMENSISMDWVDVRPVLPRGFSAMEVQGGNSIYYNYRDLVIRELLPQLGPALQDAENGTGATVKVSVTLIPEEDSRENQEDRLERQYRQGKYWTLLNRDRLTKETRLRKGQVIRVLGPDNDVWWCVVSRPTTTTQDGIYFEGFVARDRKEAQDLALYQSHGIQQEGSYRTFPYLTGNNGAGTFVFTQDITPGNIKVLQVDGSVAQS